MTREDGTTYKLYWSKSNLGKEGLCPNPEDFGVYYAWGETEVKLDYSWSTYKFGSSSDGPFSKYNTNEASGTVDNIIVLEEADDVAHVKLGGKWRMPTDAEWAELLEKCTWVWMEQNDVNGYEVTAPNGKSIFLPAAGFRYNTASYDIGSSGFYLSSSLNSDYPYTARYVYFISNDMSRGSSGRYYGRSIRPVSE